MKLKTRKQRDDRGRKSAKQLLENARVSVGEHVEVTAARERILIRKVSRTKFDLAEMVSRIPHDDRVHEESFGKPIGKEAW
jgi:antitoxin component of MazEF toxin-antitoxin module